MARVRAVSTSAIGGRGPTSLLEISEGYSIQAKNEDDMVRKAPMSPMSPVKAAVTNVWTNQPKEAVVHRARLRNFNEGPHEIDALRSWKLPLKKIKSTISIGDESTSAGSAAGSDAPEVRNLGSQELARRNRDAVDWFRSSRAANRKVRSIEDTETLLAQARERRDSGPDLITRDAARAIPLGKECEAEQKGANETEQNVESTAKPEARARRNIDPALLYAAKPKPKEEPKRDAVIDNTARTSAMRGNVSIGKTGEGGLLARLRLKAAANKIIKANQAISAMRGLSKRRTIN